MGNKNARDFGAKKVFNTVTKSNLVANNDHRRNKTLKINGLIKASANKFKAPIKATIFLEKSTKNYA